MNSSSGARKVFLNGFLSYMHISNVNMYSYAINQLRSWATYMPSLYVTKLGGHLYTYSSPFTLKARR